MTPGSARIFISYRRDERTRHLAGRLGDRLRQRFGPDSVFIDIDRIEPGVDFVQALEKALAQCDVLVALIGPDWSDVVDKHGNRRLDAPDDFVVTEVRTALHRADVRVIPVLVENAEMPDAQALPEPLRPLVRRHATRMGYESFGADCTRLTEVLEGVLGQGPGADAATRRPWKAELLERSGGRWRWLVTLTDEVHEVRLTHTTLDKSRVYVDGTAVGEKRGDDVYIAFELSDGQASRSVVVRSAGMKDFGSTRSFLEGLAEGVTFGWYTSIGRITLSVADRVLFSG